MTGEATFHCQSPANIQGTLADVANCLNQMPFLDATGVQIQYEVEIRPVSRKRRTNTQNSCMWAWAEMCAKSLNDAGLDQRVVLNPEMPIPWSKDTFIDRCWRKVQEVLTGEKSTKNPKTTDYPIIAETIARHIAETQGHALPPWPTMFNEGGKA